MKFKLHIALTDKDYVDYNLFQTLRAPYGRKTIMKLRILVGLVVLAVMLLSLIGGGFTAEAFVGIIPMLLLLAVMQLIIVPVFSVLLKRQIKTMTKFGRAGYSPEADMEFFEEYFTEITTEGKTESKYSAIERTSIVNGNVIYLHINNVGAYIIPFVSFESEQRRSEFLDFMKTKCKTVDIYHKR